MKNPHAVARLNCLSAGSVSLTRGRRETGIAVAGASQLPFGWVCFSNLSRVIGTGCLMRRRLNCLSAGSVSLTRHQWKIVEFCRRSQLPFGWVCFSNLLSEAAGLGAREKVSIAFRLGLFL